MRTEKVRRTQSLENQRQNLLKQERRSVAPLFLLFSMLGMSNFIPSGGTLRAV